MDPKNECHNEVPVSLLQIESKLSPLRKPPFVEYQDDCAAQ